MIKILIAVAIGLILAWFVCDIVDYIENKANKRKQEKI